LLKNKKNINLIGNVKNEKIFCLNNIIINNKKNNYLRNYKISENLLIKAFK